MSRRQLPQIEAFQPPSDDVVELLGPVSARERWQPVALASADADRTIYVDQEIGERWDGSGITVQFIRDKLRAMGPGDVTVIIDSPGGEYFTGLAIYNLLREHDGEVNAHVIGIAASAASVIAMAADKLRVAKAGFLMVHNCWGICLGNRHDMQEVAAIQLKLDTVMHEVYSARTGKDKKAIEKLMDDESYLSGTEAIELGFADDYLPSDLKVEARQISEQTRALNELEIQLIKAHTPRAKRRALLQQAKEGKPRAVHDEGELKAAADMTVLERIAKNFG